MERCLIIKKQKLLDCEVLERSAVNCALVQSVLLHLQIAELKRGAEIIVCTPGRMIDMLGANSGESPPPHPDWMCRCSRCLCDSV